MPTLYYLRTELRKEPADSFDSVSILDTGPIPWVNGIPVSMPMDPGERVRAKGSPVRDAGTLLDERDTMFGIRFFAFLDLKDMVMRDRNHPSIIFWSIGNEIDYPNDPYTHPVLGDRYKPEHPHSDRLGVVAGKLAALVRSLDTTRPVTAALHFGLVMKCVSILGLSRSRKGFLRTEAYVD